MAILFKIVVVTFTFLPIVSEGLDAFKLKPFESYSRPCGQKLINIAENDPLGDLRKFVGKTVFFKGPFVEKGIKPFEVEYQVDVKRVASREEGFRKIIQGLKNRAFAHDSEQEAAAFSFFEEWGFRGFNVGGDFRETFFFSSRLPNLILARNHRQALQQALRRLEDCLKEENSLSFLKFRRDGEGDFVIERFHTHPSTVNAPPTAKDAIEDARFRQWMLSSSLFKSVKFRSYVIPLYYDGEIYIEFEPGKHRIF